MDRQNRVLAIMLAAEHLFDLTGLELLFERFEGLTEFGVYRLAGFGPFDEHRQIVAFLLERRIQIAILLEAPAPLQDLLSVGLILPEIRRRGTRLEAGEFFFRSCGFKDSSASRRRAW